MIKQYIPGLLEVKEEVGIEIEVSGKGLPISILNDRHTEYSWKVVSDYSVKGEEGLEYVLRNPITRQNVKPSLDFLFERFKVKGSIILPENTAGIHIHINIQEFSFKQFINFIVLYYLYEKSLIAYCGKSREGNHFCLGLEDADYTLDLLIRCIREKTIRILDTRSIRYSSLNLTSLFKFGSLEFRGFRSTKRVASINKWIKILLAFKDKALTYDNPLEILQEYSGLSGEGLFNDILGGLKIPYIDSTKSMYKILDLIYCVDWKEYEYKQEPRLAPEELGLNIEEENRDQRIVQGFGF